MNKAIKNGAQAMQTKNSHAANPIKNPPITPSWNSKQRGTYVRDIHGKLK